jgi:ATP phosphoribosyltransferase
VIATLRRNGLSPSELPIAGSAVAMIVESSDCMNKEHETIREITSRFVRAVVIGGFGETIGIDGSYTQPRDS